MDSRTWKEIRVSIAVILGLLFIQEILLSALVDGIYDLSHGGSSSSCLSVDTLRLNTIYTDSLSTNSIIVNPIMFYED